MGVTQYIGSRYVPVFADPAEWNSTRTYEPLTIVLHEGNSYTSKQYVPVGVDISNEDFWKLTGNYNAQVEQYRQEVAGYSQRIDNANTTASNAATTANNALNNSIATESHRKNKALFAFGDSWVNPTTEWYSGYIELLAKKLGCNIVKNFGDGGASIDAQDGANTSESIHLQVTNAAKAADEATDYDRYDVKYVVIIGGTNNFWVNNFDSLQFALACNSLCEYAQSKFPNAVVHHFINNSLMKQPDYLSGDIGNATRYENLRKSLNAFKGYALPYTSLNMLPHITRTSFYYKDWLHPSKEVGDEFATILYSLIMGQSITPSKAMDDDSDTSITMHHADESGVTVTFTATNNGVNKITFGLGSATLLGYLCSNPIGLLGRADNNNVFLAGAPKDGFYLNTPDITNKLCVFKGTF